MSLLLHIIVTYIKETIITKLQKLYSLPRNSRVGIKLPALFVKKPLCKAIYHPHAKYSLKGLSIYDNLRKIKPGQDDHKTGC